MTRLSLFLAGFLLALVVATAVQAQAVSAAGQVDSVFGTRSRGDAVLRRNGQSLPVRDYMYLQPGDTIVVASPDVAVRIYIGGESSARRISFSNSPYKVPAVSARRPPAGATSMMASVDYLFTDRRRPIPVYTRSRGPADPPPIIQAHPLLPTGPQRLPKSVSRIALVWLGGDGDVSVEAGERRSRIENSTQNWLVMPRPDEPSFRLSVADTSLNWPVSQVEDSDVPSPPWGALPAHPGDAERLARAVWLLTGASEWRLFALSEIEALAATNFAAQRLWHAVKAGELTAIAGASSAQ